MTKRWIRLLPCDHGALIALIVSLLGSAPAWAEDEAKKDPQKDPHAGHNMSAAGKSTDPGLQDADESLMDHGSMDMESMDHESMDMESMDHGSMDMESMDMESMDMGSMQGGRAPADARDPHAYAGGQDFGPFPQHFGGTTRFATLLFDNFEIGRVDGETFGAYDFQGWYGNTYDGAVLKGEGDFADGQIEEARSELLWGHAITSYWDTQLGVRYDSGDGPNRSWLAFGVQGLAPYWFEVEATGYLGENGRTALRLDLSYELPLNQKVFLQPRIEADIFGKNDPARGLGKGLAELNLQLRLRYEIRREFAPYVGVEWVSKYGNTKDLAQAAGQDSSDIRIVAGLRYWF